MLTREQFLKTVAGATAANVNKYFDAFFAAMAEFGIDTSERQVMFLSQVLTESGEFGVVVENLNYSQDGLLKTFSKYFKNAAAAADYAHQPAKIASKVYANRMGNGNEASQDGWKFKGRGLIQITGKDDYVKFGTFIKKDVVGDPSYMESVEGACRSAAWYWKVNNLNKFADAHDVVGCSKAVNGGTNGLSLRVFYYNRGIGVLGDTSTAAAPTAFKTLAQGARGAAVEEVQKKLGLPVDGAFGPATTLAVKDFQKRMGLDVDGVVGQKTYAALEK